MDKYVQVVIYPHVQNVFGKTFLVSFSTRKNMKENPAVFIFTCWNANKLQPFNMSTNGCSLMFCIAINNGYISLHKIAIPMNRALNGQEPISSRTHFMPYCCGGQYQVYSIRCLCHLGYQGRCRVELNTRANRTFKEYIRPLDTKLICLVPSTDCAVTLNWHMASKGLKYKTVCDWLVEIISTTESIIKHFKMCWKSCNQQLNKLLCRYHQTF